MRDDSKDQLIDFAIDVVGQFGYENRFGYYHGGLSTLELAHSILYKHGVIKKFDLVRFSEIKKYYNDKK